MTNPRQVTMTRVIDGDTVEVETGGGLFSRSRKERVRLYGIDAPESSQGGGKNSTKHLRRLIGSRRRMWLDQMDTDRYGRIVGLIYSRKDHPEDSYNYMMVRDGQARCYMIRGQHRRSFEEAERAATERGWGIWKKRNQESPSEYRKRQIRGTKRRGKLKLVLVLAVAALIAATALYLKLGLPMPQWP